MNNNNMGIPSSEIVRRAQNVIQNLPQESSSVLVVRGVVLFAFLLLPGRPELKNIDIHITTCHETSLESEIKNPISKVPIKIIKVSYFSLFIPTRTESQRRLKSRFLKASIEIQHLFT